MTDLERIDQIIGEIKENHDRPGIRPVTSNQLRNRADYRRSLSTQIKLSGGTVRPEYQYDEYQSE